jgi:hypothetical protein
MDSYFGDVSVYPSHSRATYYVSLRISGHTQLAAFPEIFQFGRAGSSTFLFFTKVFC